MTDPSSPPSRPARSTRRRRLFAVVCIVIGPLLASGLDHAIGWLTPEPARSLLFPSGSRIEHESCEFQVDVVISSAGLRDREYEAIAAPGHQRFVAVGDSFTFGWGVPVGESWPKVLESNLNAAGRRGSEVINFGFPGASPTDYLWMAASALKHFAPDVLIVGTLQGDDLIQLALQEPPEVPWGRRLGQAVFPTITRSLQPDPAPIESYRQVFLKSQAYLRSQFTSEQRRRYAGLTEQVRGCFERGLLNPSLVDTAIQDPGRFERLTAADSKLRERGEREWLSCLEGLKAACDGNNCRLKVVVVPNGPYVSAAAAAGMRDVGYSVPASLLTTGVPDRIIEAACDRLGVDCLVPTEEFRRADDGDYVRLDGHFTARGHRRLADAVHRWLERK